MGCVQENTERHCHNLPADPRDGHSDFGSPIQAEQCVDSDAKRKDQRGVVSQERKTKSAK